MENQAKIITLAHQKGGVGKSVICSLVATELHARKYKTVLLDADKQGSLYLKRQEQLKENPQAQAYPLFHIPDINKLGDFINAESSNFDYIIIDSPGEINQSVKNILYNSDYIITPLTAGDTDWSSFQTFIKVVRDLLEDNDNVKMVALYNKVRKTNRWKEYMEIIPEYLMEMEIMLPGMDSFIFNKQQPLQLGFRDEYETVDTINPITARTNISWKVKDESRNFIEAIIKQLI